MQYTIPQVPNAASLSCSHRKYPSAPVGGQASDTPCPAARHVHTHTSPPTLDTSQTGRQTHMNTDSNRIHPNTGTHTQHLSALNGIQPQRPTQVHTQPHPHTRPPVHKPRHNFPGPNKHVSKHLYTQNIPTRKRNTHDIPLHLSQFTFHPSYMGTHTSTDPQISALQQISPHGSQ